MGARVDLPAGVRPDNRTRKGALEQGDEPLLHRQREVALRAQGLQDVGEHVGEQHLVAQPLLPDNQQRAAFQVVAGRPAGAIDQEAGEIGEGRIEPGLIGLPALGYPAQVEEQGRSGELHHGPLLGQTHLGEGRVAVGDRALRVA